MMHPNRKDDAKRNRYGRARGPNISDSRSERHLMNAWSVVDLGFSYNVIPKHSVDVLYVRLSLPVQSHLNMMMHAGHNRLSLEKLTHPAKSWRDTMRSVMLGCH